MIVSGKDRVLVQGMTGRQGSYWTERMLEVGTSVVAGVSPGKGGREVAGCPVYDTVADAVAQHQIDVSVLFVPPMGAGAAVTEAVTAGVRSVVCLAEHIPSADVMRMLAVAREHGSQVLGPNTAGLVVPGECSVGIMPGFAENIFRRGNVAVVSRSGSLGTLVSMTLVDEGFGQSVFLGIGGDPLLGTTTLDAVRAAAQYPGTEAIVLVGEIGGAMEEEAAEHLHELGLPVVAFIAGRSAPPGRRMGHAGAIVTGDRGSGTSKVDALTAAGAVVVDVPSQTGSALRDLGVKPVVDAGH